MRPVYEVMRPWSPDADVITVIESSPSRDNTLELSKLFFQI